MRHPDPISFIEGTLINPETGRAFVLTTAERRFLAHAFKLTADGRLCFPELLFSGPMKTGKTALAAMIVLYVVCALGTRFAEGICVANDYEQSSTRVFQAIARIVEASPILDADATVGVDKITFASTGSTIIAIASDHVSAAGANPTIVCFDELWGFVSEKARRLWDELVPPPTRKIACRLTVTYAGFTNESSLLEELYKRGLKGKQVKRDLYATDDGMLMFWTHDFTASWQTEAWREQMRATLRPAAYLRRIENRWVSSETSFIDLEAWDRCVDPTAHLLLADRALPVWVGVDASVKRDSTAIVACTYDRMANKVRMVWHRVFQPSAADPLDFEGTVENTLAELRTRFMLRQVRYDPYQMAAVAQRLLKRGLPMSEFSQTVGNLTEASQNLYELIKGQNLIAYRDDQVRLAVQRAVAIEGVRGWKISKEKAAHKIDVVVALAMAAHAAVQGGIMHMPMRVTQAALDRVRMSGWGSPRAVLEANFNASRVRF
jgi:phage terminase large subunit-like protein